LTVSFRTLTLSATGIPATALPKLMPLSLPDTGRVELVDLQLNDTLQNNQLTGERKEVIRIYPSASGTLNLPALDLPWWDTAKDQTRNTVIAAHSLQIQDSDQAIPAPVNPQPVTAQPVSTDTPPQSHASDVSLWLFAGLLLLTMASATVLSLRLRKTPPTQPDPAVDKTQFSHTAISQPNETPPVAIRPEAPSTAPLTSTQRPVAKHQSPEERAFDTLLVSCELNDARAARYNLLNWSQLFWQTEPPQSLEEIGLRARNQALNLMIMELEQLLFSGQTQRWNGQRLREGLSRYRQQANPL